MIRESARKEFELARHETDPEIVQYSNCPFSFLPPDMPPFQIARLLVGGRDAVQATVDKVRMLTINEICIQLLASFLPD